MFGLSRKVLFSYLIAAFLLIPTVFATEPENFINEKPPADNAPVPGDYAMPDVQASKIAYEAYKQALISEETLILNDTLMNVGGDITFTAIKNESAKVQGYFRNFISIVEFIDGKPTSMNMLIDINSLDTAVPGRNNRILDLFFKSAEATLGTAKIDLNVFDLAGKSVAELSNGQIHEVSASGKILLNGVEKDLRVELNVQKIGKTWKVATAKSVELWISEFAFSERVPAFLKSCSHKSLGNKVTVDVNIYLR